MAFTIGDIVSHWEHGAGVVCSPYIDGTTAVFFISQTTGLEEFIGQRIVVHNTMLSRAGGDVGKRFLRRVRDLRIFIDMALEDNN